VHDEKILNKHNVNLYNAEFLCGDKIIQYVSVSVLVLENYVSFHNKPDLNVTKWNNCDGASIRHVILIQTDFRDNFISSVLNSAGTSAG
jgi:hypothetical protein